MRGETFVCPCCDNRTAACVKERHGKKERWACGACAAWGEFIGEHLAWRERPARAKEAEK